MRAPRVAIVGGGIGGLAAALALERRGAEVIVCEQSPALNEIGAGLNLSPNALVALRVLGVEDAIIALGSESDFLIIRSWKSGRIISRMRRGAFRQQFGARLAYRCTAPACSTCCAARSKRSISILEPAASPSKSAVAAGWRALPTAARLRPTSSSAPTAFILLCGGACSALTCRDSPAVSAGAAWPPLARCRATLPLRKARCGWARMAMSCTTQKG